MDVPMLGDIGPAAWFGVKVLFILSMGIYSIFAFVIIRQVDLMTKTLQLGLESTLKVFAYLHFLLAICLLLISILVL